MLFFGGLIYSKSIPRDRLKTKLTVCLYQYRASSSMR
jgi:hypothetical protein